MPWPTRVPAEFEERLRNVLDFVQGYIAEHGYAPTVREIATELGRSPSTVHEALGVLQDRGLVTWQRRSFRTLRVLL